MASTFVDGGATFPNGAPWPKSSAGMIVAGSSSFVVTPHSRSDGPSLQPLMKRIFGSAIVPFSSRNDLSCNWAPFAVPKRTTVVVVCGSRLTLGALASGALVHEAPGATASTR